MAFTRTLRRISDGANLDLGYKIVIRASPNRPRNITIEQHSHVTMLQNRYVNQSEPAKVKLSAVMQQPHHISFCIPRPLPDTSGTVTVALYLKESRYLSSAGGAAVPHNAVTTAAARALRVQCAPGITLGARVWGLLRHPVTHAYIPHVYIYMYMSIYIHTHKFLSNMQVCTYTDMYLYIYIYTHLSSICVCGPRHRSGSGSTSGFGAASAINRRGPA